ncbi:Uncharacterised protein [Chlamydia trachomatis]|nr:Uncharacterised protein [Chlamydia trachomatis]
MMPILQTPGLITPGQFGPIKELALFSIREATSSISLIGIPSVIQTISSIPASSASKMASTANGGGTKIIEARQPVACLASKTESKMGKSKNWLPPFPGVTPPTKLDP